MHNISSSLTSPMRKPFSRGKVLSLGVDSSVTDDLVLRSRQGDKQALGDLIISFAGMIQAVSGRMSRDRQLQEDIFQEVVLRVIRSIKDFKGACKFSTWLYRITVNVTLTLLSREGWYKKMAGLDEIPEHCMQDNCHTEESVERKRLLGHAMMVVETLSMENREIFSLFYFADASVDEIAGQTGKSKNAVKAILFKARRAIAKDMRKKGLMARI